MSSINHILVLLAAAGSLLLGMGLGLIAPEELKPGRKYFIYLEKLFLTFAFLPIIYQVGSSLMILFPVVLLVFLLLTKSDIKIFAVYFVFVVLFYFSLSDGLIMTLEAAAIFLYGLPAGSMLLQQLFPATVAKLDKKFKIF
ncbi:hypothetical protein ACFLZB_03475 [Nanoarchaeota archaeon]